ncbi:zinc-dependent alcohol dehydrogenase family protein [Oryzifoliimicrobium ureilyticus]|uniref:zinc-dependent alcohol dehydrogenase family protein n=1 Tax=Oryzifoliimicrobium ureilyticus TaxID=3113724 RepID=UPI0030762DD2
MQAIVFSEKGTATVEKIDMPELRPGHALIRIKASGLCHTDIDVLHARYGEGRFPIVPGHEFAGCVEAVASDVRSLALGARVVTDPNLPCGTCRSCQKGLTNLCRDLKAYGVTTNGGFAEYCVVKAEHLHDIGTLDFATAALAEPLACVLNGLHSAGLQEGAIAPERALVFGAGPIGLLIALSLKARGVKEVSIADINEARLEFSADLGLTPLRSASGDLASFRRHFDFVADATGIASVAEAMIDYTADGGTIMIFGVCAPEAHISIAPFEVFRRQIRICGSHSLNGNIPEALGILHHDEGAMARLVSHRLALQDVLRFFTSKPSSAAMKVQYTSE